MSPTRFILACTVLILAPFSGSLLIADEKLNFVFILVDDLGKEDLGIEGTKFYEMTTSALSPMFFGLS